MRQGPLTAPAMVNHSELRLASLPGTQELSLHGDRRTAATQPAGNPSLTERSKRGLMNLHHGRIDLIT